MSKPRSVFVLENGCYSDTRVVGVYSTQAAAEMASRVFTDEPSISEYIVNEHVSDMRRGCTPYLVRLHRDTGDVLDCYEQTYPGANTVSEDVNKNLVTFCWAKHKQHAVKIASERRREFIAALGA